MEAFGYQSPGALLLSLPTVGSIGNAPSLTKVVRLRPNDRSVAKVAARHAPWLFTYSDARQSGARRMRRPPLEPPGASMKYITHLGHAADGTTSLHPQSNS